MRLSDFSKHCIIFAILLPVGCSDLERDDQHNKEILLWEEWLETGMPDAVSGDGPYYAFFPE